MNVYVTTAILAALWGASTCACALAIVFTLQKPPRRTLLSCIFAVTALAIGYLGLASWTPFPLFPEVAYTWLSDDFEISLQSNWFFLVPLLLGATALLFAILRARTSSRAA